MRKDAKIFLAGHRGLAGAAMLRRLQAAGYNNIITRPHAQLDLTDQQAVAAFFSAEAPTYVFLAAARVGGIHANRTYPAEFIHQNLTIQSNIIHQSYLHGVERLLFLGSSCIYPKEAPQPMREAYLMTGLLEPTNAAYAMAKIAGIQMCWSYNQQYGTRFIPLMPTNLYGPGDNFDLLNSHVLPALIRKFHLAKLALQKDWQAIVRDEAIFGPIPADFKRALGMDPQTGRALKDAEPKVILWGSGAPLREFMLADDLADASLFIMCSPWEKLVSAVADPTAMLFNVGTGVDQTIKSLALLTSRVVGHRGEVVWDDRMPDGIARKLLDATRLKRLGWQAQTRLEDGLRQTYDWYRSQSDAS